MGKRETKRKTVSANVSDSDRDDDLDVRDLLDGENAPDDTTNARDDDEPAAVWMDAAYLKPWDRNPRKNDENVKRVADSIRRFGFSAPIVARREDMRIIAGHTRWKAARALGMRRVPVRLLDISEREAGLLALADNRLNELAPWDAPELHRLLSEYGIEDAALAGWSSEDLEKMADDLLAGGEGAGAGVDEDEAPPPPKEPVTRVGDVWLLGDHVLTCGDSRAETGTFGMVVTDPPYGISVVRDNMVGNARFKGVAKKGLYEPIAGDHEIPDVRFLLERAPMVVIWGGNYFADQLPPSNSWLVWDKRGDSGIENSFADCELAWSNYGGPARVYRQLWNGMIREGEHEKRVHPTQKPVALMAWCVSFGDGPVLDCYAGSGSTLIACENLGRRCTAYELSPAYCDAIVARWEKLTGKKAVRRAS